jgi:hypothetical protein
VERAGVGLIQDNSSRSLGLWRRVILSHWSLFPLRNMRQDYWPSLGRDVEIWEEETMGRL